MTRALHQHGVVVRCDDSSRKTVTTIETNTVTTRGAVDFDLSRVWRETLGRIFGGDTTLHSETTSGNAVLGEAQLCERCTGSDLDLGCDDIDASDFFGDSMLDLAARESV